MPERISFPVPNLLSPVVPAIEAEISTSVVVLLIDKAVGVRTPPELIN